MWQGHVAHTNESRRTCEWVLSQDKIEELRETLEASETKLLQSYEDVETLNAQLQRVQNEAQQRYLFIYE